MSWNRLSSNEKAPSQSQRIPVNTPIESNETVDWHYHSCLGHSWGWIGREALRFHRFRQFRHSAKPPTNTSNRQKRSYFAAEKLQCHTWHAPLYCEPIWAANLASLWFYIPKSWWHFTWKKYLPHAKFWQLRQLISQQNAILDELTTLFLFNISLE